MSNIASRRPAWAWLVALAVATSLLFALLRQMDWSHVGQELHNLRPGWLVIAVGFNLAIIAIWAIQWSVFLPRAKRVAYRRVFEIVALTTMVLNTVPYMVGHASGVLLLARRGKVGHTAALSVLALDQLAEGLAKLSILVLVAVFIPIPPWLQQGIIGLVTGVALLLVILSWFAHRHRELRPPKGSDKSSRLSVVAQLISKWAHQLEALRSAKVFGTGLLLALAMKIAEITAILCVQRSLGVDLPIWSALLILATVGLATMVAIAPANLGVYEATVFFVYRYLGATPEQALGLALMQHLCYLIPLVGTGYLLILRQNLRHYRRDRSLGATRLADET